MKQDSSQREDVSGTAAPPGSSQHGNTNVPPSELRTIDFEAVIEQTAHPPRESQPLIQQYREQNERVTGVLTGSASETDRQDITPERYAEGICELAMVDPQQAGDWIGELTILIEGFDDAVADVAGRALDRIGDRRPEELERWIPDLLTLVESDSRAARFYGLRGLAQVAAVNPASVTDHIDTVIEQLTAESDRARKATFAVLAEVAPEAPDAIRPIDRDLASALRDDVPDVRASAAMTAGRLLTVSPTQYPRTVTALFETIEADADRVRKFANIALVNIATEAPAALPEKDRVVHHLDELQDRDLGLEKGTIATAQNSILRHLAGFD